MTLDPKAETLTDLPEAWINVIGGFGSPAPA